MGRERSKKQDRSEPDPTSESKPDERTRRREEGPDRLQVCQMFLVESLHRSGKKNEI